LSLLIGIASLHATCPGCTEFGDGIVWGTTGASTLNEASGIAVSAKNHGVVWMHNDDGSDGRVFAFSTNGAYLARFYFGLVLGDVEDMALGPGPVEGADYLYVGDIGGAHQPNEVRNSVRIVRIPEPGVSLSWAANPPSLFFPGVEAFTLLYPDGSFEAETLLLDPVTSDLFVGTKQGGSTRIYRTNLNSATNNQTLVMEYVVTVPFSSASGGAISANGGRIILRRESSAAIWIRCQGETVGNALGRAGQSVPVIGSPTEANGEAIAFTPDSSGYVTISDSTFQPPIYFFPALCSLTALGTEITQQPQSFQVEPGADGQLTVAAAGEEISYQWSFRGSAISGADSPTLLLTNLQPTASGAYTVLVKGAGGSVLSSAAIVTVRILPPVIVMQPSNTLAAVGGTAELSVGVSGTPPFTYAWTRNARRLADTGATLSLSNVQRTNNGKFRVVVSNSAGTVASAVAQLKVLNPPAIVISPQPRTASVGTRVVFRARAKGSLPLRYQWLFNGMPVAGAVRPQLVLTSVQAIQSGQYSLSVSNAVGTVTSSAAELLVQ
jgi:hypothetical protein